MAKILKYLSEENLFAFANDKISVKLEEVEEENVKTFSVGKLYSLQENQCDGFEMRKNVYKLVAVLHELNQVEFHSLIMKPIDVETSMVFSLTRQDCNNLGIEFQEGLQIFPIGLNWVCMDCAEGEDIGYFSREFNDDDLSTYPVDQDSKTIMRMVIRLTGFSQIAFNLIRTPNGVTMGLKELVSSLEIHFKETSEPYPNAHKKSLKGRIITDILSESSLLGGYIVDNSTNSIFIELDLTFKDLSNNKIYGLNPRFFSNKCVNDVFIISWLEEEQRMINSLGARSRINRRRNLSEFDYAIEEMETQWETHLRNLPRISSQL